MQIQWPYTSVSKNKNVLDLGVEGAYAHSGLREKHLKLS